MIVTIEIPNIVIPPPQKARSAGIHVSSIIRCIAAETNILVLRPEELAELSLVELKQSTRFDDPVVALRVSMGLAWEEWYIKTQLPNAIDHPDEMHCDGIFLSPDGEELDWIIRGKQTDLIHKIHEVKCTYKSTKTVGETEEDLKHQFMWMSQTKSYCHAAKTRYCDLHVLFVDGDYSFPMRPSAKIFHLEFDQHEIDDNWDLITSYRDHRLQVEIDRELKNYMEGEDE